MRIKALQRTGDPLVLSGFWHTWQVSRAARGTGPRPLKAMILGGVISETSEETRDSADEATVEPRGLRGWLGVLVILTLITALRLFYFIGTDLLPLFWDGTWDFLTSPANESYHPLWGPLIVYELVANLLMAGYAMYVFFLFMGERAAARSHFNTFALVSVALVFVDAALGGIVLPDQPMLDAETSRELGRSIVFAVVWILYLHGSRRAQNTLVR